MARDELCAVLEILPHQSTARTMRGVHSAHRKKCRRTRLSSVRHEADSALWQKRLLADEMCRVLARHPTIHPPNPGQHAHAP